MRGRLWLEARGWGMDEDETAAAAAEEAAAKAAEAERPPTVLTSPGYADYFS